MSNHNISHTPASRANKTSETLPAVSSVVDGRVNPSIAGPIPAAASPAPTTAPVDTKKPNPKQSFIRHTPSSYNHFAYQQKTGKELAPHLIDESGMASRFHLLSTELFLNRVPMDRPTDEDRKKFKKATLTEGMSEHDMYPELAAVVQSVLEAAGCNALRFLDTANHKAKDGYASKKDTFNDGGIYMNTPPAHEATEFTSDHRTRSTLTPEQLEKRLLGLRSWNWIEILFELKKSEDLAAFYFKTKPRGRGFKKMFEEASAQASATTAAAESSANQDDAAATTDMPPLDDDDDDDNNDDNNDDNDGTGEGNSGTKPETTTRTVPPFVRQSKDGEAALAQFIEYMHNVRKSQHRIFSYAVYVCYDMARLFYFDRSGAYVSEAFFWTEPDSFLHQFVWKIAKLANAGRFDDLGRDPTAVLVSGDLKDKFTALKDDVTLLPHVREGFKKAVADNCPIYQLEVAHGEPTEDEWFPDEPFPPPKGCDGSSTGQPPADPSSGKSVSRPSSPPDPVPAASDTTSAPSGRKFLVGRPHFAADSLIGRCTTGYYAYDVTDADEKNWRVCFLKDSWRPVVPGRTRPEHLLYERFGRCGVTPDHGIGTLICGGDVGGRWAQKTCVQDHLPEAKRPVLRVHYRIVIEEIGIRLEDFQNFSELSAVFSDAMHGHYQAWVSAKVLHRDISVGNIMIRVALDGTREGFLIDWDLSRLECELGIGPVEPDRTGTWQFRSALSLKYPWKPYRVSDDIESFIHAYIYLVLRYHVVEVISLRELVTTLFEAASLIQGVKVGGERKVYLFRGTELPFTIRTNPELENFLTGIVVWCNQSYKGINLHEMDRRYGFMADEKTAPDASGSQPPTTIRRNPRRQRAALPLADAPDDALINARLKSLSRTTGASPDTDPCILTGFLSTHGGLSRLFDEHAETGSNRLDKAADQFLARRREDIFQGPTDPGNRRLGSCSTSGTFASGSSGAFAQGLPSSLKQVSTGGTSSDAKKRGRRAEEASSEREGDAPSDEEEPPQSTPLSKRVKKVVGRRNRV